LKTLKEFMDRLDFVRMRPNNAVIQGGTITAPLAGNPPEARATVRALVEEGKAYALYVRGGTHAELVLDLPPGSYRAEWVNPKTGQADGVTGFKHAGGNKILVSPAYSEDIALRIQRSRDEP